MSREYIERNCRIPVTGTYDVIVAGGGIAGVAAALAAVRAGAKTLLLEKQTWLGGLATNGLVNFWEPLDNGAGKIIMHGIAEEMFRESLKYGYDTLPQAWKNGEPEKPDGTRLMTRYSQGIFALVMLKMLRDAGAEVMFDVIASEPVMEGKHCAGVITDGKNGLEFLRTGAVIDATGDADMLYKAGAPVVEGGNFYTYYAEGITLDGCKRAVETGKIGAAYSLFFGGVSDLHGDGHPPEKPLYHGGGTAVINQYLQENQLELLRKEADPALRDKRAIHILPGIPQLRTIRRLDGDVTLTGEENAAYCETSVGVAADFEHDDRNYEIPYGVMTHAGYDNMLACGRNASGVKRGWEIMRVIPVAALTGEAAGLAAVQTLREKLPAPEISISGLQDALRKNGIKIHLEE